MAINDTDIGTNYKTKMPTMASDANIQEALLMYHYGKKDFSDLNSIPANSVEGHFQAVNKRVSEVALAGSGGKVTASEPLIISEGDLVVSVPNGYIWMDSTGIVEDQEGEAPTSITVKTASHTLVIGDSGKTVEMNSSSENTLTIPLNSSVSFAVGSRIIVVQVGSGQTTISGSVGVTINSLSGNKKISGQYGVAKLYKRGTDEWVLYGDLTA